MSDEEALSHYSATYADVVAACKERYSDFVKNKKFDQQMKLVKADPDCSHLRSSIPKVRGVLRYSFTIWMPHLLSWMLLTQGTPSVIWMVDGWRGAGRD